VTEELGAGGVDTSTGREIDLKKAREGGIRVIHVKSRFGGGGGEATTP